MAGRGVSDGSIVAVLVGLAVRVGLNVGVGLGVSDGTIVLVDSIVGDGKTMAFSFCWMAFWIWAALGWQAENRIRRAMRQMVFFMFHAFSVVRILFLRLRSTLPGLVVTTH